MAVSSQLNKSSALTVLVRSDILDDMDTTSESLIRLAIYIQSAGGRMLVVGGAVRDMCQAGSFDLTLVSADIDIEVYGLHMWDLQNTLDELGYSYDLVGESFAVLKVYIPGIEFPVDISLPRREKMVGGGGHKDFDIITDPFMSFEEASSRRDFTMNALFYDVLTGEIIDPHGGRLHAALGYICHTSAAFEEDPLRPLRAARFAARFGMSVHLGTVELCRVMYPMAEFLPPERIWTELRNALLQADRPGLFFATLNQIGWIDIFPEVAALRGVEQDKVWHPEGDVFTHTCYALDYWAQNLRTGNDEDDLTVGVGILCHDFGKVFATQMVDGRYTAHDHESKGVMPTDLFLRRFGQKELAKRVAPLVNDHLKPVTVSTSAAIRRLSTRVDRLDLLALLSKADQAGRPPKDYCEGHAKVDAFTAKVAALGVKDGKPKPLVGGDYLIKKGLTPGPIFREILDAMYELQLDGVIKSKEAAEWWVSHQVSWRIKAGKL